VQDSRDHVAVLWETGAGLPHHFNIQERRKMSYCRFSNADIYLFHHAGGYISCCACSLAPKVKSIFTTGCKKGESIFKKDIEPCSKCNGEGCDSCMISGETMLGSYEDAIQHVKDHIANGDHVPEYVIPRIEHDRRLDMLMSSSRYRRNKSIRDHKRKLLLRKKIRSRRSGKKPRARRFTIPVRGITKKYPRMA
jgi:hypothetical protein